MRSWRTRTATASRPRGATSAVCGYTLSAPNAIACVSTLTTCSTCTHVVHDDMLHNMAHATHTSEPDRFMSCMLLQRSALVFCSAVDCPKITSASKLLLLCKQLFAVETAGTAGMLLAKWLTRHALRLPSLTSGLILPALLSK